MKNLTLHWATQQLFEQTALRIQRDFQAAMEQLQEELERLDGADDDDAPGRECVYCGEFFTNESSKNRSGWMERNGLWYCPACPVPATPISR